MDFEILGGKLAPMDRDCKIRCGINGEEDSKKQNNGFVVRNYDYEETKEQFT